MKYICIFHLKNPGSLHDDFWCFFLNIWIFFGVLLINFSNLMLPGIYNPTYEMCSCTLQDHSQPKKFEKTGIVFSLFTLLLFTFVALRINIYKHQMKSSAAPLHPNQTHHLPNKLLADLTLTTGFSLLFAAASIVKYIVGSTHTINNAICLSFSITNYLYFNEHLIFCKKCKWTKIYFKRVKRFSY